MSWYGPVADATAQERLDDMLAMTEPLHPTKVTFPEFLEIFVEAQREDDPHKVIIPCPVRLRIAHYTLV
jgi:hypothetical protein